MPLLKQTTRFRKLGPPCSKQESSSSTRKPLILEIIEKILSSQWLRAGVAVEDDDDEVEEDPRHFGRIWPISPKP
jgi:hypothetical protein